MDCILGYPLAIGSLGVEGRLLFRDPPEDGHKFVVGGAVLRRQGGASLSEPVHRALGQASLIAPLPHPIAEALNRESLSIVGD